MPLCAGIIAAMTYSPAVIDKWWLAQVMISIQIDGWIFKFISEQCFSLIICLQDGLSLTLTSIDATANMVVTTSQCLLMQKNVPELQKRQSGSAAHGVRYCQNDLSIF